MARNFWKALLFALILGGGYWAYRYFGWSHYLDFAYLKDHRLLLRRYVETHYALSVAIYIAAYVATAFVLPGAVILSLVGGFLFDVLPASLYINIGATAGAVLALLLSRHLVGASIQERYAEQLEMLNRSINLHGAHYLLAFRIVPVLPFFAINYLAGFTRIPLGTFIWTTSLGILPGSIMYTYIGRELGSIERPQDILSGRLVIAMALLVLFSISPAILNHFKLHRKPR